MYHVNTNHVTTKPKKIVAIGGGTGTFMVLSALKDSPVHLTAIVSMADDGGSTGVLRDDYGVLPPGDVRRALVALSRENVSMRKLFNYRFKTGGLNGHSFGNLLLTALEKVTGDFASAVREASRILNINGEVAPITLDNVRLHARLVDGTVIHGETNIDIPIDGARAPIEKVWLEPQATINPCAKRAIQEADLIVIGPGDLYTSIIPNLLVRGTRAAIAKSKAKKVFMCNLMTKAGETDGFVAEGFLTAMEQYLGKDVLDYAIFNSREPSPAILKQYERERAEFIAPPSVESQSRTSKPKYIVTDLIGNGKLMRHGPRKKVAEAILALLK
jgi:uncharacterized cofD-like protein